VRDWRYLYRPVDLGRSARVIPGFMDRALARFPDDPSLRLERAIAAASRFNITPDGGSLGILTLLRDTQESAAGLLAGLVNDPIVGAEARLRLGYLHWTLGRDVAARNELAKAAAQATDSDLRYLAQFLLGWIAIARGDSAAAIPSLEAALAARPGSQSAAVALASLELQRGDADKAQAIARATLDRPADLDPWRLFFYGHHPQWPARLAALRRAVTP
jgi:tetratricopeptide (TPR) repeat protein